MNRARPARLDERLRSGRAGIPTAAPRLRRMRDQEESLVDLLREVVSRAEDVVAGEERVRALLDAVVAVAGDLDLHATLQRVAASAARLADARFAALGVLNVAGDGLAEFVTHGVSDEERAAIGPLPQGHGILGLLITDARPLRLHDLTEHPDSYGFPAHHPPMTSFLGVPVRCRDRVFGNLYLTEKRGAGDFTVEDEQAVVALAATAGIAIDNARMFEQTQRREQWVGATAEIQRALLRRVELPEALALVATRAREVAAADLALVVLEDDEGGLRVEAVDGGATDSDLVARTLPRTGSLADVVNHGATVRLSEGMSLPGIEGVHAALLVPFTGAGGAGGALLVAVRSAQEAAWTAEEDVDPMRGFAAQAALALDRAQAQEDRMTLAVFSDRDRIARDLHDLVIQQLFATGLSLQGTARRLADRPEAAERVRTAIDDLDATIRDIRSAIFELGHGDDRTSLGAQIDDVVAAATDTLGFRPGLELAGPLDTAVPDAVRPHLLAVLVEALANAARHADATRVDVRVAVSDGHVSVEVRDDGRGFVAGGRESGLGNMRDRADTVGGSCRIDTRAGQGTRVHWTAPTGAGEGA